MLRALHAMSRLLLLLVLMVPANGYPLTDVVAGRIVCSPAPPLPWLKVGYNTVSLKVDGVEIG